MVAGSFHIVAFYKMNYYNIKKYANIYIQTLSARKRVKIINNKTAEKST